MELPKTFAEKTLTIPYMLIRWSFNLTGNTAGVFLIPGTIVIIGILLFLITGNIDKLPASMWLTMLFCSLTLPMLYYGQYKTTQEIFESLDRVMPENLADLDNIKSKIFSYYNNRWYYWVGIFVLISVIYPMYTTFLEPYNSISISIWGVFFFSYVAFIGGYGMVCSVAFFSILKAILKIKFNLDANHPDLFMGLKPLGGLSVLNTIVASSSALLFPLIFDATKSNNELSIYVWTILIVITLALIFSFVSSLFMIKSKIEEERDACLIETEDEYQNLLSEYKRERKLEVKELLYLLLIEKSKLKEIRMYPFETKMMAQVITSILLPIIMLYIEKSDFFNQIGRVK